MKIVSNSSPLIALEKIEKLGILEYDIVIPKAVEYLELIVGKGEAETIVISEELNADAVLIDDLKARKIARLRGLKVIGTIGVLLDAKRKGRISEIKPLLDELIEKKIRISKELYDNALELANEKSICAV